MTNIQADLAPIGLHVRRKHGMRQVKIPVGYWYECGCGTTAEVAVRLRSKDNHFICPTRGCNVLLFPKRRRATGTPFFETADLRSGRAHAPKCPYELSKKHSGSPLPNGHPDEQDPAEIPLLIPTVLGSTIPRLRIWRGDETDEEISALKASGTEVIVAGTLEDVTTAYDVLGDERHLYRLLLGGVDGSYADRVRTLDEIRNSQSPIDWRTVIMTTLCTVRRGDRHGVVFIDSLHTRDSRVSLTIRNRYREPKIGKGYLADLLPADENAPLPARVRLFWYGSNPTSSRLEPPEDEIENSFAVRPVV